MYASTNLSKQPLWGDPNKNCHKHKSFRRHLVQPTPEKVRRDQLLIPYKWQMDMFFVFDISVVARMVSCSKMSFWNVFVLSCRPLRLFSTGPTLIAPSRKLFDIVHRVWNFSKNWTHCSERLWHCTTHCVWNVVFGIVVSSRCFHMGVTNFAPHHVVCF